jgi:hypothetical protein
MILVVVVVGSVVVFLPIIPAHRQVVGPPVNCDTHPDVCGELARVRVGFGPECSVQMLASLSYFLTGEGVVIVLSTPTCG